MKTKQAKIKHETGLKRRIAAMLISFWIFIFMGFALLLITAQPVSAEISVPCIPGEIIQDCDPPSFQDIEYTMATCVTSAFALAGLIFGYYFIANVVIPYFSFNPDKMGDAKKAFGPWLGGMVAFFLSVPAAANVMALFINTDVECYAASSAPGFTIFFSSVCTEGDSVRPVLTGTVGLAGDNLSEEAIVYLINVDTNEIIQSDITDDANVFKMVVDPGTYNMVFCAEQGGEEYRGSISNVNITSGTVTRNYSLSKGACPY